jgi:ketosteroid isomerase-like protein
VGEDADIELVHRAWEARTRGDRDAFAATLAPDARWRAIDDGPWSCASREAIVDMMVRARAEGLAGRIELATRVGERIIVGFRPERPEMLGERPLDGGLAYLVLTVRDAHIVELKGCADRAGALAYARTGRPAPPRRRPPAVDDVAAPPAQGVSRLVPFVRVADVERSIDFYRVLGFVARRVYMPRDRLVWAALESERAELMLALARDPVEPGAQGVLFYLYAADLAGLREQLLAAGIAAGEISDGTPGPRLEMQVLDPDEYVVMVAQIE